MHTRVIYGPPLPYPTHCISSYCYDVYLTTKRTGLNGLGAILHFLFLQSGPLIHLSICIPIHIHMKERIMDDFDPTNPATLSGHLKALELLGQLTARAGSARRYVRAHVAFLFVPLSVSPSHTNSHADMLTRKCTYAHLHTLSLSLSLSYPHIYTSTHTHTLLLSLLSYN